MNLSKIRTLCETRVGGLKKLASEIGMTEANLHRRINANDIKASALEKIAQVSGVTVGSFFDETPIEHYEQHGERSLMAKHIGKVEMDSRKIVEVEESERLNVEELVLPDNCPEQARRAIEKLESDLIHANALLAEKERLINVLMEKK